jgi:diadenosine tetraphosphate (Ap4A) HIT family hydrolase
MFQLDERLASSSELAFDLPLGQVRMANESRYPWLLLIPRKPNVREIIDLSAAEQGQIWRESAFLATMLNTLHNPDKLNVAAIGNIVEQCHVHHVARWRNDAAWPDPIWGKFPPTPYIDEEKQNRLALYRDYFNQQGNQQQ